MRDDIRSALAGWTLKNSDLYSAISLDTGYKTRNTRESAEVARKITQVEAPRSKGWAIPLHTRNSPRLSSEYVIWLPERDSIGWWDPDFGISGTVRFSDIEEVEGTVIAYRLRFWASNELTPQETSFELPPGTLNPINKLDTSEQNRFFTDLTEFVKEERQIERQTNWEQYKEWSLDESIERGYATGPFLSLGQVKDKYGSIGFKYQLTSEPVEKRSEVDLTSEYGLYAGTEVILDADIEDSQFPIPVTLVEVSGPDIVAEPKWENIDGRSVVEKQLNGLSSDVWVSPLLNPVPYKRELEAISQVKSNQSKRNLISGNRPLRFITNEYAVPESNIDLNEHQQKALVWADSAADLVCIHGPPGTGKTRTLTAYVQHAVTNGQSVLITAHSNQAVDNLLVGDSTVDGAEPGTLHAFAQDEDVTIARVGSNIRNRVVEGYYGSNFPGTADIVAATTSGASQFDQNEFDVAVVDEATQASRPSTAIVLNCARKLVLAGDHKQLPPYCADETMQDEEMHISLFEYLLDRYGSDLSVLLKTQYRMHQQIAEFPNQAFYEGALETAARNRDWTISDLKPLMGIHIEGTEQTERRSKSKFNLDEAEAVAKQVQLLTMNGVEPEDIGVITAYSGQKSKVKQKINEVDIERPWGVTVDTIDSFQGGEREAIIVSFVRSNESGNSGFLELPDVGPRRLNVALTRARKRLVLIGNWETLGERGPRQSSEESSAHLYKELAAWIRNKNLMLEAGR